MDSDDKKVQFQEYHVPRSSLEEKSKLVEWVISHSGGLVKNEKQASYTILGFFGLSLVVTIILLSNAFGGPSMKLQPEEKTFFEKGGNSESYDKQIFKQ